MALRVLDGNQTATTLSSVVTGGEHIVAHSVVSLGANAIANITSAVSGSVVSISNFPSTQTVAGTVTANTAYAVNVTGNAGGAASTVTAIPVALVDRGVYGGNLLGYNGTNTYLNTAIESVGGNSLRAGGTFPVSGTVTIGSLPAISGTVTANGGDFTAVDGSVTIPARAAAIGFYDTAGNGLFKLANSDDQLFPVRVANGVPLPISGTVTVGNSVTIGSLPAISGTVTANLFGYDQANDQQAKVQITEDGYLAVALQANNLGNIPISGTVTIGNTVTVSQSGSVTANSIFPRVTLIDGSGTVTTANTAITVFASSSTRSYLLVQVTTGSAFVNVGATATTVNGINLTAGQGYSWETTIPQGIVSLISTTTNSRYVAKEA